MYKAYVHTKYYPNKEPIATISFELPEKEWEELEETDAWKSVERFLERKRNGIPNKFEALKAVTDIRKFSELMYDILKDKESPQENEKFLSEEFSEEGLQTLESITQGDYPLDMPATRAILTPTKITDGCVECNVRLVAGQKK